MNQFAIEREIQSLLDYAFYLGEVSASGNNDEAAMHVKMLELNKSMQLIIEKSSLSDEERLHECPFCGSKDVIFARNWDSPDNEYGIGCNNCGATVFWEDIDGHGYEDIEDAIAAWNRRADK